MPARLPHAALALLPLLYRPSEAAIVLSVSESQVGIFEREGQLTPVRIPGIRAKRYAREEVEALARKWCAAAQEKHT